MNAAEGQAVISGAGVVSHRRPERWPCGCVILLASMLLASPGGAQEASLEQGETVRVELVPGAVSAQRVGSPWEGTFIMFRDETVLTRNPLGGALAFPFDEIRSLEVQRPRSTAYTVGRGVLAGTVFGLGMWQFLNILCRSGCDSGGAWIPAVGAGAGVAALVAVKAPGRHWVRVTLGN